MKLTQVLRHVPEAFRIQVKVEYERTVVGKRWGANLTKPQLLCLENVLFAIQDELEHRTGRKPGKDIATLNDARNVLLDAAEVNEAREGMRWPNVDKMRKRIVGW